MAHTRIPGGRPGVLAPAAVLLLALCLLAAGAQALMVPLDDAALAKGADEIVRGRVTGVSSGWNADHTNIVTTATVHVQARAKGQGTDTLELAALGGTADGVTQWAEDQPVLVTGADAYFFIKTHSGRNPTVYGGQQGMVPIANGRAMKNSTGKGAGIPVAEFDRYLGNLSAGEAVLLPPAAEPVTRAIASTAPIIANVSPSSAPAGTGATITITGSGFGSKASRESNADVAFLYRYTPSLFFPVPPVSIWATGYPYFADNANEIVSWSDSAIVVHVPVGVTRDGYPGGASSGYVYVYTDDGQQSALSPFTVTFSYGKARWATTAAFSINPGQGDPSFVAAIRNASDTWNGAIPSSTFRLAYQGTSTGTSFGRDGANLISFGPASDFPSPGTIAGASVWTDANGTIVEADIEFNADMLWTTGTASGDAMSVEAITLHELGHWLHLRDLYGWLPGYPSDIGKVMFGYNGDPFGNQNLKTLSEADAAGIRWIYPDSRSNVSSIVPASGMPGSTIAIARLTGSGFQSGATVALRRSGSPDIPATGVTVVSPASIACRLALPADASTGAWDVVVANPGGGQATLPGSFTVSAPETYIFRAGWGVNGSEGGELHYPEDIAIDGEGYLYVADEGNHRVEKFTRDGVFITAMGTETTGASEPGTFSEPTGIAVDGEGYVYVTDMGRFRVLKFRSDGTFVMEWGTEGSGDGQFYGPTGVAVDGAGNVWVVDPSSGQRRVQKFTSDGTFLAAWKTYGKEERFGSPWDIATDGAGNVYVIDTRNNQVLKFAPSGALITAWGMEGSGAGQFSAPRGITVAGDGSVFVADSENHRVQKFTADGAPVASWGTEGSGEDEFVMPWDVVVTGDGAVFVVDRYRPGIREFAMHGTEPLMVPGGTGLPVDRDSDGLYEDVNGNGRPDFADVVLYLNQMAWIAANEPLSAFDYNGNGRIDFADVVWLFDYI